jgi:hypothetical protein
MYASPAYAQVEEDIRNTHRTQQAGIRQPATIIEDEEEPVHNVEHFSSRVVTEGMPSLFVPLQYKAGGHRYIGNCEINLATLQRMNIHAIQRDLVHLTSKIVSSGRMAVGEGDNQAVQVRELMKEYCECFVILKCPM